MINGTHGIIYADDAEAAIAKQQPGLACATRAGQDDSGKVPSCQAELPFQFAVDITHVLSILIYKFK